MKKRIVIPHEQLTSHLNSKYDARGIAGEGDITTQYAYAVLKDGKTPSIRVLNRLGIQVMYDVTSNVGRKAKP